MKENQKVSGAESRIGGKAEGLDRLSAIAGINVPVYVKIAADDDVVRQEALVADFVARNPGMDGVAVRSSVTGEDGELESFAGAFQTYLNVTPETGPILSAVSAVRAQGEKKLSEVFNAAAARPPSVGVVVQQMVSSPDLSGVCLSQGYGAADGAYMLLNFKEGLGEGLVGGAVNGRQLRVLRSGDFGAAVLSAHPFLPGLVGAMRRIEDAQGGTPVDVEFAVKNGAVYILQARPFISRTPAGALQREETLRAAEDLNARAAVLTADDVLCDMADINPRELLGAEPLPVNVALFRTMFADTVIENCRAGMGYAPLHRGLLRDLGGKPYVSLRTSAYSLRPQGISDATFGRMADIYCRMVTEDPAKQDSVEFSVFVMNARQLPAFFAANPGVFDAAEKREIEEAFTRIDSSLQAAMASFCAGYPETMRAYGEKIAALDSETPERRLEVLREGTLLFTQAARLAFYRKSVFDAQYGPDATTAALETLDTPSERMQRDLLSFACGLTGQDALAAEYGHLRAGQMDVYAPAYRDDLARNLNLADYADMDPEEADRRVNALDRRRAESEARLAVLDPAQRRDAEELRLLFTAREYVKHAFTRAYDKVATDVRSVPAAPAAERLFILLPEVLHAGTDLRCIEISARQGTFFGKDCVTAMPLVVTDENLNSLKAADVKGKILVMDHADPGYDFLLLYEPAGVITRIGGPASHIAIRVNERGLPACIGSGIDPESVDCARPYVLDCARKKHYQAEAPQQEKKHAPRPS